MWINTLVEYITPLLVSEALYPNFLRVIQFIILLYVLYLLANRFRFPKMAYSPKNLDLFFNKVELY